MKYNLEEQLLNASLLCGLEPGGSSAYRLQLFFIANKELGSKSHQSDFQRAIQTGVDKKRYWTNYKGKGTGEYLITESGFNKAKQLFGEIKPLYPPIRGKDYHTEILGTINNLTLKIETIGSDKKSTKICINDKPITSAKEACRIIEKNLKTSLPTTGDSAVRVLCNFAIDNDFDLIWKGPTI